MQLLIYIHIIIQQFLVQNLNKYIYVLYLHQVLIMRNNFRKDLLVESLYITNSKGIISRYIWK